MTQPLELAEEKDMTAIEKLPNNIISYLVSKIMGFNCNLSKDNRKTCYYCKKGDENNEEKYILYDPASFWHQGGPIIYEFGINIGPNSTSPQPTEEKWCAYIDGTDCKDGYYVVHNSPLKAAMCSLIKYKLKADKLDINEVIVQARISQA